MVIRANSFSGSYSQADIQSALYMLSNFKMIIFFISKYVHIYILTLMRIRALQALRLMSELHNETLPLLHFDKCAAFSNSFLLWLNEYRVRHRALQDIWRL